MSQQRKFSLRHGARESNRNSKKLQVSRKTGGGSDSGDGSKWYWGLQ